MLNAQEEDPEAIIKKYVLLKVLLYKPTWADNKPKKASKILDNDPLIDYL